MIIKALDIAIGDDIVSRLIHPAYVHTVPIGSCCTRRQTRGNRFRPFHPNLIFSGLFPHLARSFSVEPVISATAPSHRHRALASPAARLPTIDNATRGWTRVGFAVLRSVAASKTWGSSVIVVYGRRFFGTLARKGKAGQGSFKRFLSVSPSRPSRNHEHHRRFPSLSIRSGLHSIIVRTSVLPMNMTRSERLARGVRGRSSERLKPMFSEKG
jgi:hypothetical protein